MSRRPPFKPQKEMRIYFSTPDPLVVGQNLPEGHDHQGNGLHAEDPHQGGMAMVGGENGADLEIADHRQS